VYLISEEWFLACSGFDQAESAVQLHVLAGSFVTMGRGHFLFLLLFLCMWRWFSAFFLFPFCLALGFHA